MPASTIQRPRFHIFRIFSFALAMLPVCGAHRAAAVELSADERHLASLLTGDRGQRRDRSLMRPDPILSAVARARAQDMAARRYFSHTNPDGFGPNALVRAAGYELPSSWSGRSGNFIESIGAGYPTAEAAWEGWMHSSSHRTHLLASSSFYRGQTNFGIGSYSDPSSPYRRYWVVITAPPSSGSDAAFVSRRSAKPARIAVAMPVWSESDDGRRNALETAPRPSATRPAADKLWNWPDPISALRARASRLLGSR